MFDELKSRMNKFWNDDRTLAQTDPEFIELFSNFAYDEVVNEPGANHPSMDDATRSMAILAALIGCQGLDDFELMVPVAFESGVGAVQVKEIVYQAVAYLGFGRVLPFLKKTNEILEAKNIHLPLEPQSTTTPETALSGRAGADRHLRRAHARLRAIRAGEDPSHQQVAGRQLLRRLLHAPAGSTRADAR